MSDVRRANVEALVRKALVDGDSCDHSACGTSAQLPEMDRACQVRRVTDLIVGMSEQVERAVQRIEGGCDAANTRGHHCTALGALGRSSSKIGKEIIL